MNAATSILALMFVSLCAYYLGTQHSALMSVVETLWTRLVMSLSADMPDTSVLGIEVTVPSKLPDWAISGEYLLRDSGTWRNVNLSAYTRYAMGECPANLIALTPARLIVGVDATTPTGGRFIRTKSVRTFRLSDVEIMPQPSTARNPQPMETNAMYYIVNQESRRIVYLSMFKRRAARYLQSLRNAVQYVVEIG